MLIVYEGQDEVIITSPVDEPNAIREYFTEGGRSFDNYDRTVHPDTILISSKIRLK